MLLSVRNRVFTSVMLNRLTGYLHVPSKCSCNILVVIVVEACLPSRALADVLCILLEQLSTQSRQ